MCTVFVKRAFRGAVLLVIGLYSATGLTAQTRFEFTLQGGFTAFLGPDPVGFRFGIPDSGLGRLAPSSGNSVSAGYTVGASGRVRVGERWGAEIAGLWTFTEVTPSGLDGGAGLKIRSYTVNAVYHFPVGRASVEPFASAGGGVRTYVANETVTYPTWNVGGGLAVPVARGLEIRLEARNQMAVTDIADFQPNSDPNPSDRRFQSDLVFLAGLTIRGVSEDRH